MDLVDSHCHLDPMRYGADLPDVLTRARTAGVVGIVVVGTRAADSEAAASLAAREPGVAAAAGIHPNDTADVEADERQWDRAGAPLAAAPKRQPPLSQRHSVWRWLDREWHTATPRPRHRPRRSAHRSRPS